MDVGASATRLAIVTEVHRCEAVDAMHHFLRHFYDGAARIYKTEQHASSLRCKAASSPSMPNTLHQLISKTGLNAWPPHLLTILACGLTTALTLLLQDWLDPVNTVMLFLLTVVLIATKLGRAPAVLASFLSVALFDFCFVPPRWSFAVRDTQYLLTFAVMLIVALVIGHLANGLRDKAAQAETSAQRSSSLYALASQLACTLSVDQVQEAMQRFAQAQWQAKITLFLPDASEQLHIVREQTPSVTAEPNASPLSMIVQACFRGHAGATITHHDDDGHLHAVLNLAGSTRCRGVLVVSVPHPQPSTTRHQHQARLSASDLAVQRPLLQAVAALLAAALERLHFVEVAHHTQMEMRDERLRNSILSALSHDIRTPLTSLFGLAGALTLIQPPLPAQAQDMAQAMRDQAMRLHRMVSNLLDMARLQSSLQKGYMPLRREWQPIEEVMGASIQLLGSSLGPQQVKVHLAPDLPMVSIDSVLMERVFGNLLENASKYSPPGSDIHVHVDTETSDNTLHVRVCNEGKGFAEHKLQDVFQVFERGHAESNIPGMGLGLAICQAIVQAHGGRIRALNPVQGGAEVSFTLPLGTPPSIEPELAPQVSA